MLPKTYQEILTQHYVNCQINLYSEFQIEKYFHSGIFIADVDDTLEAEKTLRLIDLLFERLGSDDINPEFGMQLPEIRQDIAAMYQTRYISAHVKRMSERFKQTKVTRKQFEEASRWAVEHYQINPTFRKFVEEDLPSLGFEFLINTGNFEYTMQYLAGKIGLPLEVLKCSTIRYRKEGDEEYVEEIYANVLENKQTVNRNEAAERGLSQNMIVTLAESPKFEPDFAIYAGLAVWVDSSARKVPVESKVNLYIPEARKDLTKITAKLKNWRIGLTDSLLDSMEMEKEIIKAIKKVKIYETDLESKNELLIRQASERMALESRKFLGRIRRHRPREAERMEGYLQLLSLQQTHSRQRFYTYKLLKIIKETIAEYYNTEELEKLLYD